MQQVIAHFSGDCTGRTIWCGEVQFLILASVLHRPFSAGDLASCNYLSVTGTGLTKLSAGVFSGLSGLNRIDLRGNHLTGSSAEALSDVSRLGELDLDCSFLEFVPESLLQTLGSLFVSGRQETSFPKLNIKSMQNLVQLFVYSLNLTVLPAGVFSGLSRLEDLGLYENQLTELQAGVFSELPRLQGIHLYGNQLTELQSGVFDGLTALRLLDLHGNNIAMLDLSLLKSSPGLTYLSLDTDVNVCLPQGMWLGSLSNVIVCDIQWWVSQHCSMGSSRFMHVAVCAGTPCASLYFLTHTL